jgi:hypothetical protein
MPTPTYTALANITLGSSASSVTFSSIPATYRDLVLVINGSNTANATLQSQFNGDTASNYTVVDAFGSGSSPSSSTSGANTAMNLTQNGAIGAGRVAFVVQFMDYSATDKHKTVLVRKNMDGSSFPGVGMVAGRWASTSALNSIRLAPSGGSFTSGSTFSLYGIAA